MAIEVDATIIGIEQLKAHMDLGLAILSNKIAVTVQRNARKETPVGTIGNSTNPPGDLAASIIVDGPHYLGPHTTFAEVGPTTIYGRQRELGGDIVPINAPYLVFSIFDEWIKTVHVFQKDDPYLYRGLLVSKPKILSLTRSTIARVLLLS